MKILVSNDDGWDAPGIAALAEVASEFGEVVVMAPEFPQSGISHQLTFDRPLRLKEHKPGRYSLDGTPGDCVRVALHHFDFEFDWVLSGINHGANLGADVFVSGTVAAAREAWMHGTRAIAFSQYRNAMGAPFSWTDSQGLTRDVLAHLTKIEELSLFNVNFPDHSHTSDWSNVLTRHSEVDPSPLPNDYLFEDGQFVYRGCYQSRARTPNHDIDICFSGNIAVSRLG